MWECPDFFSLDGGQVLFVSPHDMSPIGLEFRAGNCTVCLIGSYDPETNTFERRQFGPSIMVLEKYDLIV